MQAINIRSAIKPGGFVESYLRWVEDFEYPESYAVMALLAMASCAVDKRVLINPGFKPETWTNVYVVLCGPSGARKSEALMDALSLLGEALPDAPIYPMNFTMEALRGRMHADSADKGRTAGLIVAEELSTLLGGREYLLNNSLFLGKVWDARPYETFLTIAHQEQIIRNSYVVLGACSTPEAFADLDPRAMSAGFLRRLVGCMEYGMKKASARPPSKSAYFEGTLVPGFRQRFGAKIPATGVSMHLTPEAARLNEEWYATEIHALRTEFVGPRESHFVNSMQVHAFKFGALMQLLEDGDPRALSAESLETGIKLIRLLRPGIFDMYASLVPTPFAKLRAVAIRIAGASNGLTDAALDRTVWKEAGCTPEQAATARLSLIGDFTLTRGEDGKVRLKR